jgi:hypothetical protein
LLGSRPQRLSRLRYNDREIVRAFADNSAATFEWLVTHGVVFVNKAPDALGGNSVGNSVPRQMHSAVTHWPMAHTEEPADPEVQKTRSSGNGLMRSLELAAKEAGVEILLEHRMTSIHRQTPNSGPVLGIAVDHGGARLNIRALRAVIIGTGGMPWSDQDASGELAAMAIGASLWGFYNQIGEFGSNLTKPPSIRCQHNYRHLQWMPGSPVFDRARAPGLTVADWQDVILVNMLGKRFYETGGQYIADNNSLDPYVQGSYLNAEDLKWNLNNFLNAALAGSTTDTMAKGRSGRFSKNECQSRLMLI